MEENSIEPPSLGGYQCVLRSSLLLLPPVLGGNTCLMSQATACRRRGSGIPPNPFMQLVRVFNAPS